MLDVFNLFTTTDYEYVTLESGIGGDRITSQTLANGVVKYRNGLTAEINTETHTSDATIHIRPDEPFVSADGTGLVGNGVIVEGETYRITGVKVGFDYDLGVTGFYLCTLQKEATWDELELPLE